MSVRDSDVDAPGVDTAVDAEERLSPPDRARRFFFVSRGDEPRARRPADLALLALGLGGIVLASLLAADDDTDEFTVGDALQVLLGWLDVLWHLAYAANTVFVVLLLLAALAERRPRLVRDMVLALATAIAAGFVLGRLVDGVWPDLTQLAWVRSPSSYPALRVAAITAVVRVSRPDLTRPARRTGTTLVIVGALAAVVIGEAEASDAFAGLSIGLASAALIALVFGSAGGFPDRGRVLNGLAALDVEVTELEPSPRQPAGAATYVARDPFGHLLEVKVCGRDALDTQYATRAWRLLWYRDPGQELAFTRLQQVEHESLLTLLADRAEVPVPRVVTAGVVESGDALLVTTLPAAPRLAEVDTVDDTFLDELWQAVLRLRSNGIAHGRLNTRAVAVDDGHPLLLDFSAARVSAPPAALATDVAELLVSTALIVGHDRALRVAHRHLGDEAVADALPYLQRAALTPWLRDEVRRRDDDPEELRTAAAALTGVELPAVAEVRRVTVRGLVLMVLTVVAAYTLISQLADVGLATVIDELRNASWQWLVVALVISQMTLVSQAIAVRGAVATPLPLWPTVLLESAIKFINLTVPSSAGKIAINIRYLQRLGVAPLVAATAGALDGLAGTAVEIVLLLLILPSIDLDIDFSGVNSNLFWLGLVILGVAAAAVVVCLVIRRLRAKVLPVIMAALHNLKLVLTSPRRLVILLGANLATEVLFALTLGASTHAYGVGVPLPELIFINMAVTVFASIIPIPGGIGVAEAGLTAGLVAAGVPEDVAFAAAITHRMVTFYLPPIWGYFSLRWLSSRGYV